MQPRPVALKILDWLTVILLGVASYLAIVWAPTEATMGNVQRVFYFHVAAGWVGMTATLCYPAVWLLQGVGRWREVLVLALFGGFWGLVFGIIMNIWFWPFATGPASHYWEPGISLAEILQRYATFYLATSLVWDVARALGNVALTLLLGLPTLRALRRFRARFTFEYQPAAVRGEA